MTDKQIAEMFQRDWAIEKGKKTKKEKKVKTDESYSCNREWSDEEMDIHL